MRLIRLTAIAVVIAALASFPVEGFRTKPLRRAYEFPMDHQSGGITCSSTRFFTGTDTGTMEERSHDLHLLDVRNTYNTGSGQATFSNATNRLGSFSPLHAGVTDDVFYFCSEDDNAVYRYNTGTHAMDRMAGNGVAGLLAGTGTAARIDCGTAAVQSARDDGRTKLYMFSGRGGANYGIVSVVVTAATGIDNAALTIVAGTGSYGHTDGTGTNAAIQDLHGMLFYKDSVSTTEYLIMAFSDVNGPIRWMNLGTGQVTTSGIQHRTTEIRSGADGNARTPHVLGLVRAPGEQFGYGITETSRIFTLSWSRNLGSFQMVFHPHPLSGKWGAAMRPDGTRVFFGNNIPGNGTIARFEVTPFTITKTPPPTRTHTQTNSLPSRTIPLTPAPTPRPPTPVPSTPSPSNVGLGTTLAPGATNNSTLGAASGATVTAIVASSAAAFLLYIS